MFRSPLLCALLCHLLFHCCLRLCTFRHHCCILPAQYGRPLRLTEPCPPYFLRPLFLPAKETTNSVREDDSSREKIPDGGQIRKQVFFFFVYYFCRFVDWTQSCMFQTCVKTCEPRLNAFFGYYFVMPGNVPRNKYGFETQIDTSPAEFTLGEVSFVLF